MKTAIRPSSVVKAATATLLVLALAPAAGQQPDGGSRERLRADIGFLASPPLEGRASLTQGADAAAWFIAAEMAKAGLLPPDGRSHLQPFDLVPVRLDRDRSSVVIRAGRDASPVAPESAERRFVPGAVFFPDPARPVDLDLPVAFAGFGITAPELGYDDYAGLDVRGKAVLVFDHEPQEDDPGSVFLGTGFTLHANAWTKTRTAQQHGAAALIVVTEPNNRHRAAPRAPERANAQPQALTTSELRIPRFSVPLDAAVALLEGTGRTPAQWQADIDRSGRPASRDLPGVRVTLRGVNADAAVPPRPSLNVAGLLPGADPALSDETILVTAHYDHLGVQNGRLYPGANDNASGVAALLEAARLLRGKRLPRSVLFMAFGSEEQLMLGSYYYVAHPLRSLATTRAVLNLDMIGRAEGHTPESEGAYAVTGGRSNELNLVGGVFSPALVSLLRREAAATGVTLSDKFDGDSSMRALFRCDHLPFLQQGVPAVWLFGGFHPGYHEPADTIDLLDFDKVTRAVSLTVASVRALAAERQAPGYHPSGVHRTSSVRPLQQDHDR